MSAEAARLHDLRADDAIDAALGMLARAFMRGDTDLARGYALTVAQWRDQKMTDAEVASQFDAWDDMARTSPSANAQWDWDAA